MIEKVSVSSFKKQTFKIGEKNNWLSQFFVSIPTFGKIENYLLFEKGRYGTERFEPNNKKFKHF